MYPMNIAVYLQILLRYKRVLYSNINTFYIIIYRIEQWMDSAQPFILSTTEYTTLFFAISIFIYPNDLICYISL